MWKTGGSKKKRLRHNGTILPFATLVPLDATVLMDIDRLIQTFAKGTLRSFASFRLLAASWRALDLFFTKNRGSREPPKFETTEQYVVLILEAIMRRVVEDGMPHEMRLGAMYLLLLLHELQPCRPRVSAPVLEAQWQGFERLASEVRTLRNPDGFACLHALWTGGRLEHRAGERMSANTADVHYSEVAEAEARRLPMILHVADLGPASSAQALKTELPRMFELEARCEKDADAVREAARGRTPAATSADGADGGTYEDRHDFDGDGADEDGAERTAPAAQLAPLLLNELRQYLSGRPWETPLSESDGDGDERPSAAALRANVGVKNAAAAAADDDDEDADEDGEHYLRRQAVRHRQYNPGQRRHSLTGGR